MCQIVLDEQRSILVLIGIGNTNDQPTALRSVEHEAAADLIEHSFPVDDWNIYCFQFSDGDNWGDDNRRAFELLAEKLLPASNLFCYGQVESPYGSGEYLRALRNGLEEGSDNLMLSEIADKEAIIDSIKLFLGKGK